jgi:acetolactate synthase-1/2/3 large subunit
MNGAEALIQTLSDSGVDVCFANPGTSEMQLVAAIDGHENMRAVLGLFEGVVTGAADGYGRMADKPAATLLHVGAGLANGCANLHNAKRAFSPVVNIVGDHATYHLKYNAPLTSDIAGIAAPFSNWLETSISPDDLAVKGAEAITAALQFPGQIATLIAPADHAWDEVHTKSAVATTPKTPHTSDDKIQQAVHALSQDGPTAILLGARALREDALHLAGRIAAKTGAKLICETFTTRLQRGAGRVTPERIPYFGEQAADFLKDYKHTILVGTAAPVSFFAYPEKPSWLLPEAVDPITLATPQQCPIDALTRLASAVDAPQDPAHVQQSFVPPSEDGPLNPVSLGSVLADLMPENAIVSDGAATTGLALFPTTAGAKPHDWMMVTGGAIGQGLPVGIGAAIACPDRKVLCLEADGSAMYTVQSLWTMARENLDIVTVILNNGSYAILNIELARVGVANPGPKALSMLDLTNPAINWVEISEGMGVPAVRTDTTEAFRAALIDALAHKGPRLIEAIIPVPGG